MKTKKQKNELKIVGIESKEDLRKQLEEELTSENIERIKTVAKDLMKEIRMTELLLEKRKKELEELLSGQTTVTEEDIFFGKKYNR